MTASALKDLVADGSFLDSEADLAVYSYDAALDRGRPDAVVLAASAQEAQRVVAWCARQKVPFVARGAGTNLSGGCIPLRGGVVLALARLNRILEIDEKNGVAVVEPGVVNLDLQRALEPRGFFYAPDPASFKVSTLGGNAAENAGGPRCLKYGVTTNHVLALEAVLPDGSLRRFSLADDGPEVLSLLVGAEGTLGVVTKLWLKILPLPREIRTILAGFPSIESAVECVSAVIAAGIVPRVLEAMDRVTVESVEAYAHAGYPTTEAVLLIEVDGDDAGREAAQVEDLCRRFEAAEVRSADDPARREKLWEGRRGAYAAMARLAPNVMVEDGVVPRDRLPEIVARIREICARHKLTAGLLFHAGDGNIHPNVGYDERNPEETARVKAAGRDILQACVDLGGSLSGEHGIGIDKREAMAWLFTAQTLDLFRRIKKALDPDDLANPDKLFPIEAKGPALIRRKPRPLTKGQEHLIELSKTETANCCGMQIVGSGSRLRREPGGLAALAVTACREIIDLDEKNLTVTVEAGLGVREFIMALGEKGLHVKLPDCAGTLGGLYATKAWSRLRDDLLGMRVLLPGGEVVDLGGKVVKNVAGYDVPRLLIGSWGAFGAILDLTLKVYRRPQDVSGPVAARPLSPTDVSRRLKKAFDPDNRLNPWLFA